MKLPDFVLEREGYTTWSGLFEDWAILNDLHKYLSTIPNPAIIPPNAKPEEIKEIMTELSADKKTLAAIRTTLGTYRHLAETCTHAKEAWDAVKTALDKKSTYKKWMDCFAFYRIQYSSEQDIRAYIDDVLKLRRDATKSGSVIPDVHVNMMLILSMPKTISWNQWQATYLTSNDIEKKTPNEVASALIDAHDMQNQNDSDAIAATASISTPDRMNTSSNHFKRGQNNSKGVGRRADGKIQCFKCKKWGSHTAVECRSVQKADSSLTEQANAAYGFESSSSSDEAEAELIANVIKAMKAAKRSNKGSNSRYFIVDSGATHTMVKDLSLYTSMDPNRAPQGHIQVGNGEKVQIVGKGTIQTAGITLSRVPYAPGLAYNLLSVRTLTKAGLDVHFRSKEQDCIIKSPDGGSIVAKAELNDTGLYVLVQPDIHAMIAASTTLDGNNLHQTLNHIDEKTIKKLVEQGAFGKDTTITPRDPCEACLRGKMHKRPFPKKVKPTHTRKCLKIVHSDVMQIEVPSLNGCMYAVTFIDEASDWTEVYIIRHKSEVLEKLKIFKARMENQVGKKIKILMTDNGGEYCSHDFTTFTNKYGIIHHKTVPRTPEQNGRAERKNRTLWDDVRTMLRQKNLPSNLWGEAIQHAAYIRNRVPSTKRRHHKTPQEILFGEKDDLTQLRPFGTTLFMHIDAQYRAKHTGDRGEEAVFTGIGPDAKGYRCWIRGTKKVKMSRNITFIHDDSMLQRVQERPIRNAEGAEGARHFPALHFPTLNVIPQVSNVEEADQNPPSDSDNSDNDSADSLDHEDAPNNDPLDLDPVPIEREEAIDQPPPPAANDQQTTRSGRVVKGTWKKVDNRWVNSNGKRGIILLSQMLDPDDAPLLEDALNGNERKDWADALAAEHTSFVENDVYDVVDRPRKKKVISSRWILKKKRDYLGRVAKYKGRVVARGFSQIPGEDYKETYCPTIKATTIRAMCALAALKDMEAEHMDVQTAFLNGHLKEDVYMEIPYGFPLYGVKNKVLKLKKTVYGLKQSPLGWYERIHTFLIGIGFKRCVVDHCLYTRMKDDKFTIIGLYVDDLFILTDDKLDMVKIKTQLKEEFKMSDLGPVHHLLGTIINRDRTAGTIHINQSTYIQQILQRFNMTTLKPVSTPIAQTDRPWATDDQNTHLNTPLDTTTHDYRGLVGCLQFLATMTRPDIAHAVGEVAKHNNSPTNRHWTQAIRILRYLVGTPTHGITYRRDGDNVLKGYSDANWVNNKKDARSTTGFVFVLAGGAITWKSKRQHKIAMSTQQAETFAFTEAGDECTWLQHILEMMGMEQKVTTIYCDNKATISLVNNGKITNNNRTTVLHCKKVLEMCWEDKNIETDYISTKFQVADILTKTTDKEQLQRCRYYAGILPPPNQEGELGL